jgi:CbiX
VGTIETPSSTPLSRPLQTVPGRGGAPPHPAFGRPLPEGRGNAIGDDARTAVLLIAHGSRQQAANDDLHDLVSRLAATGNHPIVEGCFLELALPDIPMGALTCVSRGATRVLMVPYFLSAGIHIERDLKQARDELSRKHPEADQISRGEAPD